MRCLLCDNLSIYHICSKCQNLFLTPNIYRKKLECGIDVISLYQYEDIAPLLHSKHTDIGFYIYKIIAKNSFYLFAKHFKYDINISSIAIDDNPKDNYSHTAILNSYLKSKYIKPVYNILRSTNKISYSGKTREFRKNNPRKFSYKNFKESTCIIVDDIVTTGFTLCEAYKKLKQNNKEVLFCLVLAHISN